MKDIILRGLRVCVMLTNLGVFGYLFGCAILLFLYGIGLYATSGDTAWRLYCNIFGFIALYACWGLVYLYTLTLRPSEPKTPQSSKEQQA